MRKRNRSSSKKTAPEETLIKVTTPVFRVSFPEVFNAVAQEKEDGTMGPLKYSITMLFEEGEDLSALENLVDVRAKEFFSGKVPKNLRTPFRDGEEKEEYEGYEEGMVFCKASTFSRPGVIDLSREPLLEAGDLYPGCYARATVSAYGYNKKGNKGVALGLRNIQKVDDGERLDGKASAEDDFADDDF